MSARTRIAGIALSCLVTAAPSLAADRAATAPVTPPSPAPATAPAAAAAKPAPAKPSRATAAKPAAAKGAAARPATPAGRRTLGDIHIEGEVPVPQVLFVTARDQRRVLDFGHHRYLRSSRDVAASTPLPARLAAPPPAAPSAVAAPAPAPAPATPRPEAP